MSQCPFVTENTYWCGCCEKTDYESCSMYKKKYEARQAVIELCKKEREQKKQDGEQD